MSPSKDNSPDALSHLLQKLPQPVQEQLSTAYTRFREAPRATQYGIGGGALLVVVLLFGSLGSGDSGDSENLVFETRRGQLDIEVLEGGTLEALQSQEIRSRVKGREGVKILSIVEEGYRVTPEDVELGTLATTLKSSMGLNTLAATLIFRARSWTSSSWV